MFHLMPAAGPFKLQDRVFHVLVVTIHSAYPAENVDASTPHSQALTFQIPVDIRSLKSVATVVESSHTDAQFKKYASANSTHNGNRLTEGFYVSVERLREGLKDAGLDVKDTSAMHQWDMMTMSDAKGITSIASQKQITKGTLEAITKDVYYVLDYIRQQREKGGNGTAAPTQGKEKKGGHGDEFKLRQVKS